MNAEWTTADIPDQTGRTFMVTGANSGLGLETARAVAARGARVVMTVRSEEKGRAAAADIISTAPDADLEVRRLDLADLDSVKAFAADYDGHLDVLVNNAGIMIPPRRLTKQGHESQFGTNHLGHFALTGLLLDRLGKGQHPRVVTVSSLAHLSGRIHFDDLTGERSYGPVRYYEQSKFANMLFTLELDRRLRAAGSPVRSLAAHPGFSDTQLMQSANALVRAAGKVVMPFVTQSAAAGALPQLYAATDPRAEGGQYFGPGGRRERKGWPVLVQPAPTAEDPGTAKRLWELSETLTGVRFPLTAAA
ncbi:oxidoreductase [Glycomyces harbinensis]|uniref:NAD(P)-dependent dehydrogenase, short-chain alcohol dehydrogenase family n=1 Tax=Glycomyces harbinensis TaxID=58114 RepID=A0A1G6VS79_9ACTN|nr:oxidoreductase [Glycomyces harbinensis]SDD56540.1 NAD(P)-dependent dehydrogenase, short-chain alcohol dehydrogenase family [Glycomyces harbinensis]